MQPGPNWKEEDLQSFKGFLHQTHQMVANAAAHAADPTVKAKCSRLELLLRVMIHLVDLDLEDTTHNVYIKSMLNNAIKQYGLEVIDRQPATI